MEVRFECIAEGKRLYTVIDFDGKSPLFTGTPNQCRRFIEVRQEKLLKSRMRDHHGGVESFAP